MRFRLRGEWWRTWLKYSETNTYQSGSIRAQLIPLWSHGSLLMWLVPKSANVCRALYMAHMLNTWLYIYLNMSHPICKQYIHSKALNPWICRVYQFIWRRTEGGMRIFRNNILQESLRSCQERTDVSPLPPTPMTSVGPLQHVSFPSSVWRWQFAFSQWAGRNTVSYLPE